jgi:hypothetical protein
MMKQLLEWLQSLNPFRAKPKIRDYTQIFGHFPDTLSEQSESLTLHFSVPIHPHKQRWKNNRLSASFVAEYFSNCLLNSDADSDAEQQQEEWKGTVSYIANELLENALKFNDPAANYRVQLNLQWLQDEQSTLILCVTNAVGAAGKEKFQGFIQNLLTSDPSELYVEQMEKTSEQENSQASGLGLLSMICDYSAQLGWKFEPIADDLSLFTVTTRVTLTV